MVRVFRQEEKRHFKESRHLANLRMLSSAFSEGYYLTKNFLDHSVGVSEAVYLQKKYLPARLAEYQGQKKIAFLFHGYMQGRSAFLRLERILESDLFGIFAVSSGYNPYSQYIEMSAERERGMIEYVLSNVDAEEVYFIGHSQGGLVIRYILQKLDGAGLANKVITLSTPHTGTWAAAGGIITRSITWPMSLIPFMPKVRGESGFQMLPNSKFLRELNSLPLPSGIEYSSIFSFIDPLVWPPSCAILPYPEAYNVLLKKIGHFQTLYNIQVFEVLLRALLLANGKKRAVPMVLTGDEYIEEKKFVKDGKVIDEFIISSD